MIKRNFFYLVLWVLMAMIYFLPGSEGAVIKNSEMDGDPSFYATEQIWPNGALTRNGTKATVNIIPGKNSASIEDITKSGYVGSGTNTLNSGNLFSSNGFQYIGFWDDSTNTKMMTGSRSLTENFAEWSLYRFDGNNGRPSIILSADDEHYTVALGKDLSGTIHVAYNMHSTALKYRKSDSTNDVSQFSTANMLGTNETAVTYPIFFNDNNGVLYFMFRDGISSNGDQYLYEYNSGSGTWAPAGGTGTNGLMIDGKNSPSTLSPYVSHPVVDSNNIIHFGYFWRDDPSNKDSTFDIGHFSYDPASDTFSQTDGTTQTMPITSSNDSPAIAIEQNNGLNASHGSYFLDVDSSGNPTLVYQKIDGSGNSNAYIAHYNGSTWTEYGSLSNASYGNYRSSISPVNTDMTRPPICLYDSNGILYVIYYDMTLSNGLVVFETSDFSEWKTYSIYTGVTGQLGFSIDRQLWDSSDTLYMLFNVVIDQTNDPSKHSGLSILKWCPSTDARVPYSKISNILSIDDVIIRSADGTISLLAGDGTLSFDADTFVQNIYGDPLNDYFTDIFLGDIHTLSNVTSGNVIALYGWTTPATTESSKSITAHNATYQTMTTADQIRKGMLWSLDFDGTSDYLSIPDHDDFSFGDGSTDQPFSIILWAETVADAVDQYIISKYDETTSSELREWEYHIRGDETVRLRIYDESANANAYITSNSPLSTTPENFRFTVLTYDGRGGANAADGLKIYVDGALLATTATNDASYIAMENLSSNVLIGAKTGTAGSIANRFKGDLGFVGIINRELTDNEIYALYIKSKGYYNE